MESKTRVEGRWSYSMEARLVGIGVGGGGGERVRSITNGRSGLRGVSTPGAKKEGRGRVGWEGTGYGNIADGMKGGGEE